MLKTIGLIGGMSWESTALYYRIINKEIASRLGGLNSAGLNLVSLNFDDIAARQRAGDWTGLTDILVDAARQLESGGAQCILIGTNTMHKVAPEVEHAVGIPLLHIAEVTADAINRAGVRKVALLGTRFTMEQPFYVERLARHGIDCVTPNEADRGEVHRIIFDELCRGVVDPASRRTLQRITTDLARVGAQGLVLGCTELPLIVRPEDVDMPVFDTTALHALAAVEFAISGAMPTSTSAVMAA